jgi:hypothetical protein
MKLHPRKMFPEVDNLELLSHQVITKKDLLIFSNLMLKELRELLGQQEQKPEWLKSMEVRKLLRISAGTLQNLRVNGSLSYKRLGGTIYYRYDDIKKMLED